VEEAQAETNCAPLAWIELEEEEETLSKYIVRNAVETVKRKSQALQEFNSKNGAG
jgi:hypothetical protein